MPRFRPLVALCAGLSLLAPAAVAAGVGVHLQWAEHHGGASHPAPHTHGHGEAHHHPGHENGTESGTTSGGGVGAPTSHSHGAPELTVAPAVCRPERTRSGGGAGEAGSVQPVQAASASGAAPAFREARGRPPDVPRRATSPPALIHLHCALLL